jgi:hypothetical protein
MIDLSVQAHYMADDAEPWIVDRILEVYLYWLFGFVMLCESAGDAVSKYKIPCTRMFTDTPMDAVPQISWGSAILSATYMGLCTIVWKGDIRQGILLSCVVLVQV